MIRFTLRCDRDHVFESWFKSGPAFEKLKAAGMVGCSVCGSGAVEKAVMAPQVCPARRSAAAPAADTEMPDRPLSAPATPAEQALAELRRRIEAQSDYVGNDFAAEARRIHSGDAPERSIFGEARVEDAKNLIDDGIPVAPLPFANPRKTN